MRAFAVTFALWTLTISAARATDPQAGATAPAASGGRVAFTVKGMDVPHSDAARGKVSAFEEELAFLAKGCEGLSTGPLPVQLEYLAEQDLTQARISWGTHLVSHYHPRGAFLEVGCASGAVKSACDAWHPGAVLVDEKTTGGVLTLGYACDSIRPLSLGVTVASSPHVIKVALLDSSSASVVVGAAGTLPNGAPNPATFFLQVAPFETSPAP